jgi:MFS family permease
MNSGGEQRAARHAPAAVDGRSDPLGTAFDPTDSAAEDGLVAGSGDEPGDEPGDERGEAVVDEPAAGMASDEPLPGQGLAHSMRAFRHRDFTLFWTGALVSNTGTWLQNVTVPFVLYELTHNALWVGLSTFAQFLPGVLFGPAGGSLADRLNRRRLLIFTQTLLAAAALLLWITWSMGLRNPGLILLLVAASGTINGLNSPSWQAFVPQLVPRGDLLSAITLNSLQFNAARALGPTAAGLVLATLGPGPAFLLNALSFGFVLGSLLLMREKTPPPRATAEERGVIRQFHSALRYVRTQPGIGMSILVAALVAFLGSPVIQFTVVYTTDIYHVGNVAFGVLSAAMGIGAAAAAPMISGWDTVLRRATIVRYGLPAYAVACALFGISGSMLVGFVGLFLAGAGFLAVISATNTSVQVIVAEVFRGRVMAARVMSYTLCYAVGGLAQGWMAERVGPRATVTGAGLVLLAVALYLAAHPAHLVALDDPPDGGWDR